MERFVAIVNGLINDYYKALDLRCLGGSWLEFFSLKLQSWSKYLDTF